MTDAPMLTTNQSDRKDIAQIILMNHSLVVVNQEGKVEAYYLSRIQPYGNPVSKRYRHILRKMKEGEGRDGCE